MASFASVTLDLIAADDTAVGLFPVGAVSSDADDYTNVTTPRINVVGLNGIPMVAGDKIQIMDATQGEVGVYTVTAADLSAGPAANWTSGTKEIQLTTALTSSATGTAHALTVLHLDSSTVPATPGTPSNPLTVTVDTSGASVTGVTSMTTSTVSVGQYLSFLVAFSEPVSVNAAGGNPLLPITVGSGTLGSPDNPRTAVFVSQPSPTTAIFRYRVTDADSNDIDGVVVNGPVDLNGGSILDRAGNLPLSLALPAGPVSTTATVIAQRGGIGRFLSPASSPPNVVISYSAARIIFDDDNNPATPAPNFAPTAVAPTGNGIVESADFTLARNGVIVPLTGATLTWATTGNYAFADFQLGNLDSITNDPGVYRLTFNDLGVSPAVDVTWVKSTPTAGELIASLSTRPADPTPATPRSTPVNQVQVRFQDNAGTAVPVTGVDTSKVGSQISQFTLFRNGTAISWADPALAAVTLTQLDGATYSLIGLAAVQAQYGEGAYQVTLNNDPLIQSLAGTQMITSYSTAWQYVNPKTIQSVVIPSDTYTLGQRIPITVTFSDIVTVVGSPEMTLTVGSRRVKTDAPVIGSGSNVLVFGYDVTTADLDADGITMAPAITGTINDGWGDAVIPTFTVPNNLADVLVDGVAPRILSTLLPPVGTYTTGEPLLFTVNFDDAVTTTGIPTLAFTMGSATRQATYDSGSGTNALTFRHVITPADATAAGLAVGASALALNGSTIRDNAGNDADLTITPVSEQNIFINRTSLVAVTATSPTSKTYRVGESIEFEAAFSAQVTVIGTPTLGLTIGTAAKTAVYLTGSGTDRLRFRYTVVAGDLDPDGIEFSRGTIDLSGGASITRNGSHALVTFSPPDTADMRVDGVTPSLLSVSAPPDRTYVLGEVLQFVATYDEAIQVTGTPRIAMVIGSATKYATFVSGSGTPVLVFEYTVAAGDNDTKGIVLGTAIDINGGRIADFAGNSGRLTFTPPATSGILIDALAATVVRFMSSTPNGTYKAGSSIAIEATLSEAVPAGSELLVTLDTGATVSLTAAAQGTRLVGTYVVRVNDSSPDLDVVSFVNVSVTDILGNPLADSTPSTMPAGVRSLAGSKAIVVDGVAPTVAITSNKTSLKSGDTAVITFLLTEASTSFTAADVTVTGGTLSGFGGSGAVYTATFTPTATSTAKGAVSVAAGVFTDAAGNGNTAGALTPQIAIDTVAPVVTIRSSKAALRSGDTAVITFLLSEASTSFTAADVTVTGGTLSNFGGSGTAYTATVTAAAAPASALVVSVPAGAFTDAAGNSNTPGSLTTPIDNFAPSIAITASRASMARGQTTVITFTLSESSTSFKADDVTTSGGSLSDFAGSGRVYTATFTPTINSTAPGSVAVAAGRFTDEAGNANGAGVLNPTITIDTVAPKVLSVTSLVPNGTYTAGQVVRLSLNLSEPVLVAGTPIVVLNTTPTRYAIYSGGSGTRSLEFSYVIQAGDAASRLDYASTLAFRINGGSVRDAAGNAVVRTLAAPAAAKSLAGSSAIAIDGAIRVAVPTYSNNLLSPTLTTQPVTTIDLTFTSPMTGVSLSGFRLFFENRSVGLTRATITGSGKTWRLTLPPSLTSLRGNYRLEIGGPNSGIVSGGVSMTAVSKIYWRRT